MYRVIPFFMVILFSFLLQEKSYSQTIQKIEPEQEALEAARSFYSKSLAEQAGIYRGVEYTGFPFRLNNGHQYFESIDHVKGSIFYDGILYKDIPMWYDIVKKQVIVLYENQFSEIKLHNELIDYFSIFNHHFVHLGRDATSKGSLTDGFYDLVYVGKTQVLVKRSKETLKEVNTGVVMTILKQRNEVYLVKGGLYLPVKSQSSVLNALGSKHKEIQDFLKKNKIKFRKDPEGSTIKMVSYFDQLSE